MSRTPSLRSVIVAGSLLAGFLVVGGLATVPRVPASATDGSPPIENAAAAVSPAVRQPAPAPVFPMEVAPRCDVLSNFADSRSSGRLHEGIDILSTLGQDVVAIATGTITAQFVEGGPQAAASGNAWRIVDGDGDVYFYAHLSTFASGLTVGSRVGAGQVIGEVGDTGNPGAGNYHLHVEYHPGGGAAVDPLTILTLPPGCRRY